MPYINISTSAKIEDKKKLLEEISILVSNSTNSFFTLNLLNFGAVLRLFKSTNLFISI